jgi:cysteine-rich repeat protein
MSLARNMTAALAIAALVACGGGGGGGDDDTGTDSEDDTTVTDTTESDTTETDTTETDTSEDTATDPGEDSTPGECGNGTVNAGEACDDSNTDTEWCGTEATNCLADCSLANAECGDGEPDDGEQCDDGNGNNTDECTNSCTTNDGLTGAPCTCTGGDCTALDFTAGTIEGCEDLAALADGTRTLGCMRTSEDTTYDVRVFGAGGYCLLMAMGCSGLGCSLVPTTGDVDAITCPTGTAMVTDVRTVLTMTITTKTCMKTCSSQADCRWNEEDDPAYDWDGTCGEWACLPGGDGGEMICTDIRNAG